MPKRCLARVGDMWTLRSCIAALNSTRSRLSLLSVSICLNVVRNESILDPTQDREISVCGLADCGFERPSWFKMSQGA
eukprot:341941-Rhodomonas_salina.7